MNIRRAMRSSVRASALAAQPLAVDEMGSGQLEGHAGAAQMIDRLAVQRLGSRALAHQGTRTCLDPERQVRPARPGGLREPPQHRSGAPDVAAPGSGLDDLHRSPSGEPRLFPAVAGPAHGGEGVLVPTERVAQQGPKPTG